MKRYPFALLLFLSALAWVGVADAQSILTAKYHSATGYNGNDFPGIEGATFGSHGEYEYYLDGSGNGHFALLAVVSGDGSKRQALIVDGELVARQGDEIENYPGEYFGSTQYRGSVNSSGDFVFANRVGGVYTLLGSFDGVLTKVLDENSGTSPIFEGDHTWGYGLEYSHILENGKIGFHAESVTGLDSAERNMMVLGDSVIAQTGVTVPTGENSEWIYLAGYFYEVNATGDHYLIGGALPFESSYRGVLAYDGVAVLSEEQIIPDSDFPDEVCEIKHIGIDNAGNWFASGYNYSGGSDINTAGGWVVRNGEVIVKDGDLVLSGSSDIWATTSGSVGKLMVGDKYGNYVIGGNAYDDSQSLVGVLVAYGMSGSKEIFARSGDPVDLDGDGQSDGVLRGLVSGSGGFLTDDGVLWFVAHVEDANGGYLGTAVLTLDAPIEMTPTPDVTLGNQRNPNKQKGGDDYSEDSRFVPFATKSEKEIVFMSTGNDADVTDTYRCGAKAGRGDFKLKILNLGPGRRNVTSQWLTNRYRVSLDPGETNPFKIKVKRGRREFRNRYSVLFRVKSTTDPSQKDVFGAEVTFR